jgi:glucokinase
VRVLLGDASRFVLTELDAGVSLKQLRARGGVHVCGGEVQPLSGRMRLHVFERTFEADCGAQCSAGSVYMQRKAAGVW